VLEAEHLAALSMDSFHAEYTSTDQDMLHPSAIKTNKKSPASHKPVQQKNRTQVAAKRTKTMHHTAVKIEKKATAYRSLKLAGLSTIPVHNLQRGQQLAQKCLLCHNLKPANKKKFGPNLFAVVNQPAGKSKHYNYSRALAKADFTWSEKNLAQWICHSGNTIKQLTGNRNARTKMTNQRICGQDANDVVAYLRSVQTSNSTASSSTTPSQHISG
jgi:cytochrome c